MGALIVKFHGLWTRQKVFFEGAERLLCRALDNNPAFHAARFQRALIYWRELHQPAKAVADFTQLLSETSKYHDTLFMRAMAYESMGNYHAAVNDLQAFLEANPESRWVRHANRQITLLLAILNDLPPQLAGGAPQLAPSTPASARNNPPQSK
jgi:tetratricopeptide (TPR) repeat protein